MSLPIRYSNSAIQNFKDCPLMYYFKDELRLQKIEEGESEHHLVYGKAIALGLKTLRLGASLEETIRVFKEAYPVQLDENDRAKTAENGAVILTRYAEIWKSERAKWRIVAVEEKDSFEYVEGGFTVVLDMVVENIEHGGIYGWDDKTVGGSKGTLGFDFWNGFEPNSQLTKYYSYVKSKYGECSGFYINAIGVGYRQKKYKGEPPGFWVRFGRQMFNRNEAQLVREQVDTQYWISRIEEARSNKRWGMNTGQCRFCSYRPICAAGWTWEEDQELITIQYEQKESKRVSV